MIASLRRLSGPTLLMIALGVAVWALAATFSGAVLLAAPVAVGAPVLAAQFLAQRRSQGAERERDEILPLLEAALPKLRVGLGVDAAFLQASEESPSEAASVIGAACRRAQAGALRSPSAADHGPMLSAILAMIASAREHGGDVVRPFEGLGQMLQADQRLRRKQQLSTLQIRRQANVLVIVALGILGASMVSSQEALLFLFQDGRGRLLVVLSATLFVWGQVTLNVLTARIGDV